MEAFALRVRTWLQVIITAVTPHFRQVLRLIGLPYCLVFLVDWRRCRRFPLAVALDHLYMFFVMRYFPDNYSNCRLYEKPRADWHYYYGSSYHPYQRAKLHQRVQPREYQVLFEDKEVCQQLCLGAGIAIAEAVGVLSPLQPPGPQIERLLEPFGDVRLIAKPVSGASGAGIFFIEKTSGRNRVIRRGEISEPDQVAIRERVLVQRLVQQHCDLDQLYSRSVNTLRILTLMDRDDRIHVISALLRCGMGDSAIDNWSAGGVAVGVDMSGGVLLATAFDKRGREYLTHPDSGVKFAGFRLPMWGAVLEFAKQVQGSFPYHPMLGLDVAIEDRGPTIIEINAFPDFILQEQASGPLLGTAENFRLFEREGLLFSRAQRKLHRIAAP